MSITPADEFVVVGGNGWAVGDTQDEALSLWVSHASAGTGANFDIVRVPGGRDDNGERYWTVSPIGGTVSWSKRPFGDDQGVVKLSQIEKRQLLVDLLCSLLERAERVAQNLRAARLPLGSRFEEKMSDVLSAAYDVSEVS